MEKEYRMSYVLGGLYYHECLEVFRIFKTCDRDWDKAKKMIKEQNLLNANRKTSLNRVYREVELRLKNLTDEELEILESGSRIEKKQILWLSCCKTYRLIYEIATELLYTKAKKRERSLSTKEYDGFYERKAEQSLKLDQLKDSTRKKVKSVTFKILREAELLNDTNKILQQFISKKVESAVKKDDSSLLKIYPMF